MNQDVDFPWEDIAPGSTQHDSAHAAHEAAPAEPDSAHAAHEAAQDSAHAAQQDTAHEDAPIELVSEPAPAPREREQPRSRPIARKEYYSIGEVSELVGLPAHVLRYWESQFPVLNPSKNRSGNRAYQRKEIRLILLVKQLLYEDKYTVEGAKTRIEQLRKGGGLAVASAGALDKELMDLLRQDVAALRQVLAKPTT